MAAEQNGFPGRSSSYDTRNIGETGNSSSSVGLVDHSNAPETSLLDVSSDKELNMSTKETSTEEPKGWGYMRQKLQKFVAVQTTIDLPKKPKRSVIEQKDFLEKFSTREYYKVGTKNTTVYTNRKISPKDATSGIHNNRISRVADMNVTNQSEQIELKPVSGRKGFDGMAETESIGYYPSCGECCENFIYAITEPYSNFMYFWLYIVIMAIHYNCWIIILRLGFPQAQRNYKIVWFVLDYMSDFIYLMDIVVSMRTSFLEDGIYVDDLQRIALAYVKSYAFVFDILSLIPLDILYFVFGTNPIFRLPRLLKYHRALKSRKILESMSHYPNLMRTLFFLHIMFLLMHWNACFYFIVSRYEGFGSNNWVFPKLPEKHLTLIHTYAKSLYWSTLSLTTIGESAGPATTLECIYMIVCYIIGIFIFATIVGQAGSVIQNMNASRMDFERQRDNTMHYMKRHKVPGDVQRRVRLWYDYSYSRGRFDGGNDINDITLLPNKMKTELSLHVHLETLRKVTFLQKCQPEFLHDLVLKMKLHIFTPGDYICRKGEIAREMYVISDGILEVVSDTGRILKVLHSGDFFGEIGLLSLSEGQNRRTADVRACGYVELFVLSKDDVLSAIQDYPKAQKVIAKYGRERLLKGSKAQGPRADTSSSSEEEEEKEQQEENIYQPADSEKPRTPQSVESVSESPENPRKYSSSGTFPRIKSPAFLDFEKRRKKSLETRSMRSSADTRLGSTLTVRSPTPRSSFGIQSAMLSFINPVVTPAASVSVETPPLQRKRRTSSQNSSARKVETRDPKDDITTEFIGTPCHFDFRNDEVFADILKASHEETLKNLKSLFRRKMADEYQRMRERIDQLEKQNEDKAREILVLKAKISSIQKPRNVASIDLVDDLSEGNEVMPHIVKVSEISHEKDMAGLDVKTSEDGTKDNISSSSANINSVQADTNAYEPPSLLHIVGTSQRSLRDPFV